MSRIISCSKQQSCASPAGWHGLFSLYICVRFSFCSTQRDAGLLDTICSNLACSVTNPNCTGTSADSNLIFPSESESPSHAPEGLHVSLWSRYRQRLWSVQLTLTDICTELSRPSFWFWLVSQLMCIRLKCICLFLRQWVQGCGRFHSINMVHYSTVRLRRGASHVGKITTFKLGHTIFDGGIRWRTFP